MQNDTATAARFTPRELPYAYDALAPQLSEETLHYHQTYTTYNTHTHIIKDKNKS